MCRRKELPLPFVSYGGFEFARNALAQAVLLNISQQAESE